MYTNWIRVAGGTFGTVYQCTAQLSQAGIKFIFTIIIMFIMNMCIDMNIHININFIVYLHI